MKPVDQVAGHLYVTRGKVFDFETLKEHRKQRESSGVELLGGFDSQYDSIQVVLAEIYIGDVQTTRNKMTFHKLAVRLSVISELVTL